MTGESGPGFREIATDALRFWERGRIAFNLVLLALSIYMLQGDVFEYLIALFSYALIANGLYTTAYIPDVFIQHSDFRGHWRRFRWLLWLAGTAFASFIAFLVLFGLAFNGWS